MGGSYRGSSLGALTLSDNVSHIVEQTFYASKIYWNCSEYKQSITDKWSTLHNQVLTRKIRCRVLNKLEESTTVIQTAKNKGFPSTCHIISIAAIKIFIKSCPNRKQQLHRTFHENHFLTQVPYGSRDSYFVCRFLSPTPNYPLPIDLEPYCA